MNKVEFYTRYDNIVKDWAAFEASKKDMSNKDIRIREQELRQQTNQLFADYMGTQINVQA